MLSNKNSSGHYSPRNSILIWVAGIVLGWGCAVVLVYQVIKGQDSVSPNSNEPMVADSRTSQMEKQLGAIEPAAGAPDRREAADQP